MIEIETLRVTVSQVLPPPPELFVRRRDRHAWGLGTLCLCRPLPTRQELHEEEDTKAVCLLLGLLLGL